MSPVDADRTVPNLPAYGLPVVAQGPVIWPVVLLVRDPQGKVRAALKRK